MLAILKDGVKDPGFPSGMVRDMIFRKSFQLKLEANCSTSVR
jgi:hypothetical protein